MNTIKHTLPAILAILLFTGCEFISNTLTYKETGKEFTKALLKEEYDKCIGHMALEHETAKKTNMDTLKMGFAKFREVIIQNFGTELDYSFIRSEQTYFSTDPKEDSPENTAVITIQISNKNEFGALEFQFDNISKKIINIKVLEIKLPIPSMTGFWLFGLLALFIPAFNIYMIRQIKQSSLNRKWLKYIAILFFNVPAVTYNAVNGLSYGLLQFQILFGISFEYMGYLNTAWTFGIPLGGLYWFWRLKMRKPEDTGEAPIQTVEQTDTPAIENEPRE